MQSNTDNFLIWGIQRILQDKEIKKNHNQELKKCCDNVLSELKEKLVENGVSSVLPPVKSDIDTLMNNGKYFQPFEMAFNSKSQTIIIIALDCLQKLIAYGHISNTALYKDTNERLIDKIINFICDAFQDGHSVDGVQLQIIKAILTIVINPNLEVHANNLISMVRTCYSIFLASKDSVNQTTAKATLTQMLNSIFNKMEIETIKITENNESVGCETINEEEIEQLNHNENKETPLETVKELLESLIDNAVSKSNLEKSIDSEIKDIETPDEENNYSIESGMIESQTIPSNKSFADVSQKDAFLVFRSLCRLSMKALPEGAIDPKSHDLRSKILSLELLLNILQNSGPVFKQNEVFINAIKQYLCVSLSKNGVSPIPEVFELSLSIFLSLLSNFKQHLKRQSEVFFKEIFLYILESPRSSFVHKDLVLEALKRICMNAQCVVDIYVNYDCDLASANIFERLVNDLAKIAQGRQMNEMGNQIQNKTSRIKALDCLFHILQCMVEWSRELYVSPESHSFFGVEQERHEGVIGSGVAPKPSKLSRNENNLTKMDSTSSVNSHSSSQSSLVNMTNHSNVFINQNSVDNPEHFATRKQQKELFENGINLFNKKPLKGLNYLQNQTLLGTSVDDVAEFLHKDDRLDKTAIGDFLGENEKYNIEVMYAFVDQFEFTEKEFVASLREFLSGFRLPGEAQKIDRLMEKFAARYCECNPTNSQFKSADTAYVLAYSIIMLTTDLHSAQIKSRNRMRKEEYIKMNRGINESGDLDIEYLGSIYDEIAGNEIKIKESTVDKKHSSYIDNKQASIISEKQRKLLFNMEMEEMAKTAKELIESISHVESDFTSATHHEHVRPMFKLVWTPFLAAFSVGLQDCDDTEISRYCLEGIRCAIRIACIFKMELERNAYIQALSRFTLLITGSSSNGIKSKNVDTIKTLISVAHTDGNYLGASWLEILRCISQLESAQLIGGTGPPHTKALSENASTLFSKRMSLFINSNDNKKFNSKSESMSNSSSNIHRSVRISGGDTDSITGINMTSLLVDQQKNIAILQEVMGETGSQSVVVAVDKVFTGSVRLDGDAIVDFVRALCQVSRDELSLPQPRIFSLQKLVEISYYNMGRIRLQWSRVWQVIGEHFTNAGLSPNEDVAIFATDSLRQLAVKFIEKGEFPNFHFQKEFLRPFVNIMEAKSHLTRNVEDMVVRCVAQLVQSHWANIRSGWTNVFMVFMKASNGASLDNESIVELAFGTLSFVVKEVFKTSFSLVVDSFQNLVKSLAEFACNTNFPDINMESIRLIRLCAKYVDEQGFLFKEVSSQDAYLSPTDNTQFTYKQPEDDDKIWLKGWMPVLSELYRVINNCKLDVRTRGLTVFFEIIKSYGTRFKSRWWRDTFSVVFRVFQHVPSGTDHANVSYGIPKFAGANDRSEWLNTTCNHTLYAVVDVFSQYYETLHMVLLDDLLIKLKWCCLQDFEQLARSGTSCLETLIISNGQKFSPEIWEKSCSLLIEVFDQSTPKQLLTWKPISPKDRTDNDDSNRYTENRVQTFASLLVKCVVQFELIQAINNIVFYPAASKKEDAELWKKASQLASTCTWMEHSNDNIERKRTNDFRGNSEPPQRNVPETDSRYFDPLIGCYLVLNSASSLDTRMQPLRSESSLSITAESIDEHLNHWGLEIPKEGLYMYLTPCQLFKLVECLLKSHEFAKQFNSDQEQRNLLWKAGFKGKAKPNLMKQETHSLSLAIRILFKLSDDSRVNATSDLTTEVVENKLISTINECLRYFRNLNTENHRESWNPIIVLILSRFSDGNLSEDRFKIYAKHFYSNLCDFVTLTSLPIEIRALYRGFLIRFGNPIIHD